ncbi:hypothetical protein H4O18_02430 [Arenibacter sp. BSSL-BM3]|uniref:Uncharacterized protein n=1 Tax=Arenibacter arenosicollis TaxID=2762274 RepID=A0ABR7QI28_9FLAO|nr:hypothetical protein [Arenibacter arenosicollis]MBC8766840.1 hypothetical protein [Arenibacter arenosicollis]
MDREYLREVKCKLLKGKDDVTARVSGVYGNAGYKDKGVEDFIGFFH